MFSDHHTVTTRQRSWFVFRAASPVGTTHHDSELVLLTALSAMMLVKFFKVARVMSRMLGLRQIAQ